MLWIVVWGNYLLKKLSRHRHSFKTRNWEDLDEKDKKKVPQSANGELIGISHEEWEEEELREHDIKAFPAIWDKLMNALDYYPKDKENDKGDKLDGFLELLGSAIKNGTK